MKSIPITIFCIILVATGYCQSIERYVIGFAGGNYKDSVIQISWTLGELVISTRSNENYILTQGFHQSKLYVTPVNQVAQSFEIKVYPNPVTQKVFIEFGKQKNYHFELYDINGKLFKKKILKSTSNVINTEGLTNGTFFLKIYYNKKMIGTYKLVKMY